MAEVGLVCADYLTQGVPVSVLDDEYGRSTVALGALIEKFSQLDLYDKERPAVRTWPASHPGLHAHICRQAAGMVSGGGTL